MRRIIFKVVAFLLVLNLALPSSLFSQVLPYMPPVGTLVTSSQTPYSLPYLVGMKFSSDNIFDFTFYLNRGNVPAQGAVLRVEAEKINKYFLAALTIPEKDLWVNLSPYEQNRIITPELGRTDLAKDLLGEDYVLKQLAASLTFPDSESGMKYWQEANGDASLACGLNGKRSVPISGTNSFTKIWIVPGTIKMKEASDRVVITEATLKVMTEEDYLAREANGDGSHFSGARSVAEKRTAPVCVNNSTKAMRDIIVPLIEKEVNTGKHFAHLRQIYRSIIMAGWFKKKLKDTVLSQVYFNQKKLKGAENDDPALKEKIYNEYVKAFNQGVYKVIRSQRVGLKISKRQYFSGGFSGSEAAFAADDPGECVLAASSDAAAKPVVSQQIGVAGGTVEVENAGSVQTIKASLDNLRQLVQRERNRPYAIARLMRLNRDTTPDEISYVMRALDVTRDPVGLAKALKGRFAEQEIAVLSTPIYQREVERAMDKFVDATPGMRESIDRSEAIVRRTQERIDPSIADDNRADEALKAFEKKVGRIANDVARAQLRKAIMLARAMYGDDPANPLALRDLVKDGGINMDQARWLVDNDFIKVASTPAKGGFDFAGTTEKNDIEAINGGLKMSADKSAASLMHGKVTGFKLAITALRY